MRTSLASLLLAVALPSVAAAQSVDLMVDNTGISIGDSRIVRGIRFNFRDRRMEQVHGINVTLWGPYDDARGGDVNGVALGLPLTGARRIQGIGVGIFGVAAEEDFAGFGIGGFGVGSGGDARGILIGGFGAGVGGDITGLTIGGFGAGSGGEVRGITIGGFGAGAGGNVSGLQVGGFGVGSGGNVKGITVGGFGAGAGGDITGLTIGGFGAGAGGNVRGITVAGIGAGAGGNVTGLTVAGIGAGAGGDLTGLTIAGLGAGAGGTLRGVAIGGAAGGSRVRALIVTLAAGGQDVKGGVLAPGYFRVESDDEGELGVFRGVSVSSFNHIRGEQRGVTIGLVNSAWTLKGGWQIGLSNYVRDQRRGPKWLPFFNRNWE
jgi:hypothetical protein